MMQQVAMMMAGGQGMPAGMLDALLPEELQELMEEEEQAELSDGDSAWETAGSGDSDQDDDGDGDEGGDAAM